MFTTRTARQRHPRTSPSQAPRVQVPTAARDSTVPWTRSRDASNVPFMPTKAGRAVQAQPDAIAHDAGPKLVGRPVGPGDARTGVPTQMSV